jgi:alkanesulfonate monooxygenase SsuD/methylene tetrahydromethanopterin reductase-like flavin-dependent oxidoreductase (luciferase family)
MPRSASRASTTAPLTSIAPAPLQRPRPPLTAGGQSPTVRRVAAERADCWNTFALGDAPIDQIVETIRRRNRELDGWCAELDRDPTDLRRSITLWHPLDPWAAPDAFARIVTAFREAGITEFIVMWPADERLGLLERAAEMIPSLRDG